MQGDRCEYCDGIIEVLSLGQESFKSKGGSVILENAPVGVCNKCGHRYLSAALLRRIDEGQRLTTDH